MLFGDHPKETFEPSGKVEAPNSQLPKERARVEREASDPEIEALFGENGATKEEPPAEERVETQAPSAKQQRIDQSPPERTPEGEQPRDIREELDIANDFELSSFIYRPLQTMG